MFTLLGLDWKTCVAHPPGRIVRSSDACQAQEGSFDWMFILLICRSSKRRGSHHLSRGWLRPLQHSLTGASLGATAKAAEPRWTTGVIREYLLVTATLGEGTRVPNVTSCVRECFDKLLELDAWTVFVT